MRAEVENHSPQAIESRLNEDQYRFSKRFGYENVRDGIHARLLRIFDAFQHASEDLVLRRVVVVATACCALNRRIVP